MNDVGTTRAAIPVSVTSGVTAAADAGPESAELVNAGAAWDPHPSPDMVDDLRALLERLSGLVDRIGIRPVPPPRADVAVKPGTVVGVLRSSAGWGAPHVSSQRTIRVEDAISSHTTREAAIQAARQYSMRNGGEPVAIIASYEPQARRAGGPVQMPVGPTFTVVTLDPAVDPDHFHRITSAPGASASRPEVDTIVQGHRMRGRGDGLVPPAPPLDPKVPPPPVPPWRHCPPFSPRPVPPLEDYRPQLIPLPRTYEVPRAALTVERPATNR